jgi:hypothetical protein
MTSTNIDDLLMKCPSVPKLTPIDDLAFNNQYDKCIQMATLLYDHIIINKNRIVTDSNIKIINEQIDKFYELSLLVKKTKQVLYKINCIEEFKKIIGMLNSKDGYSSLKSFYDSLKINSTLLTGKLSNLTDK